MKHYEFSRESDRPAVTRGVRIWLALALCCLTLPAVASPFFDATQELNISLTGPLHAVMSADDATTTGGFVLKSEGLSYAVNVGIYDRSRLTFCRNAGLKVEFADGAPIDGPFAGLDSFNLLMHCRDNEHSEQNIVDEYTAYRVFQTFSDAALRARLLRVQYQGTGTKRPRATIRYAVAVESERQIAARLGATLVQTTEPVSHADLNEEQALGVYLFQYYISNTDWSLAPAGHDRPCCRNGLLLDAGDGLLLIPDDFDRSGLVNARYAKPDRLLGQYRVTQRIYRGYCAPRDSVLSAIDDMAQRQFDIIKLTGQLPFAHESGAQKTNAFMLRYFSVADNRAALLLHFEQFCR